MPRPVLYSPTYAFHYKVFEHVGGRDYFKEEKTIQFPQNKVKYHQVVYSFSKASLAVDCMSAVQACLHIKDLSGVYEGCVETDAGRPVEKE